MARTRTLLDLLTDVADRLDVPPFGVSTFVSKSTMVRWVNQSNRRLGALVRSAFGEDYGSTGQTINILPGVAAYPLPLDYIRTLEVSVVSGGARARVVERASDFELGTVGDCNTYGYRIVGPSVVFSPTPDRAETVLHRYLPTLFAFDVANTPIADLVADTDYVDGINGWEEWIALDACRKHKVAEDQDPSLFVMEQREIEAEIKRDSKRTAAPHRLRDVYGDPE